MKAGPESPGKGRIQQRGAGAYTLCIRCNNDTGRWYGRHYADWTHGAMMTLFRARGDPGIVHAQDLAPLPIIKQIITMLFSVNGDGFRRAQQGLVRFVLNPEERGIDPRFRVFAYYMLSGKTRALGVCAAVDVRSRRTTTMSEVSFPPFGYLMTFGSEAPDGRLFEITHFTTYGYKERVSQTLRLRLLPTHTALPGDYRSLNQIYRDRDANLRAAQEDAGARLNQGGSSPRRTKVTVSVKGAGAQRLDKASQPCRLCLQAKPLLKSHVIPEFLHSATYAAKGGALSFNANREHVRILRKGIRERLLCQDCERLLMEHEDYFAAEWVQASRLPDPLPKGATEIHVDGLDYRRFKLFHLSVVWRTGVAGEDYAPIDIGEHKEPLRQMLLAGDPGRFADYPVFGYVLRMRDQPRAAKGIIALAAPERGKVLVTSTIYAGCGWHSALGREADTEFKDLYLTERGSMVLPIESIASRQSLVGLVKGRYASFRKAAGKLR